MTYFSALLPRKTSDSSGARQTQRVLPSHALDFGSFSKDVQGLTSLRSRCFEAALTNQVILVPTSDLHTDDSICGHQKIRFNLELSHIGKESRLTKLQAVS